MTDISPFHAGTSLKAGARSPRAPPRGRGASVHVLGSTCDAAMDTPSQGIRAFRSVAISEQQPAIEFSSPANGPESLERESCSCAARHGKGSKAQCSSELF